jgi:hypothetical protein
VTVRRVPDRDHRVADARLPGVAERDRLQLALVHLDLQQRDVVARVPAHELCLDRLLVGEADLDLARALDDVGVGEDVA